jgi:hypothetical protein
MRMVLPLFVRGTLLDYRQRAGLTKAGKAVESSV